MARAEFFAGKQVKKTHKKRKLEKEKKNHAAHIIIKHFPTLQETIVTKPSSTSTSKTNHHN